MVIYFFNYTTWSPRVCAALVYDQDNEALVIL